MLTNRLSVTVRAGEIILVVALLLISVLCGAVGAALAGLAGYGIITTIAFYMVGGMVGTCAFAVMVMAHCAWARAMPPHLPATPHRAKTKDSGPRQDVSRAKRSVAGRLGPA